MRSHILITTSALLCIAAPCAGSKLIISVQPLGNVDPVLVSKVKTKIKETYDVDVVVNSASNLPKEAYYTARGRYRAEKLLDYLNQIDTTATKVLGLTTKDISNPDWGILGLGGARRYCGN